MYPDRFHQSLKFIILTTVFKVFRRENSEFFLFSLKSIFLVLIKKSAQHFNISIYARLRHVAALSNAINAFMTETVIT